MCVDLPSQPGSILFIFGQTRTIFACSESLRNKHREGLQKGDTRKTLHITGLSANTMVQIATLHTIAFVSYSGFL